MSRKIIGVTVGTPISPARLDRELKPVKTVNGVSPDVDGNVDIPVGEKIIDLSDEFGLGYVEMEALNNDDLLLGCLQSKSFQFTAGDLGLDMAHLNVEKLPTVVVTGYNDSATIDKHINVVSADVGAETPADSYIPTVVLTADLSNDNYLRISQQFISDEAGDGYYTMENFTPINNATFSLVPKAQKTSDGTQFANALKGSASGEVVALKDVSPLEHGLGVRVSSKNLWKYQSSIYVEGKGENFTYVDERYNLPKGMYVFSCDVVIENLNMSSTGNAVYLGVDQEDGTTSFLSVVRDQTTSGKVVVAVNLLHSPLTRITLVRHNRFTSGTVNITNIQLEKDTTATTATAYTPFVPDVGAVKVKAMGKNLCDKSVISLSGDTTFEQSIIDYLNKYPFFRHGTYTMSADVTVYPEDTAEYRFFDVNVFYDDGSNELKRVGVASPTSTPAANLRDGKTRHYSITFDTDINKKLKGFRLRPLSASINTGRFCKAENIQLEFETETEYEPYIEPVEYAVSADGTVEGVKSIYPATTLTTDTVGALIEVDYNRDINKAFAELQQAIISLGGNV